MNGCIRLFVELNPNEINVKFECKELGGLNGVWFFFVNASAGRVLLWVSEKGRAIKVWLDNITIDPLGYLMVRRRW